MAEGLFLVGTDRGVGKTIIGVGLVALLREQGIPATMMTPISTGGGVEKTTALLRRVGDDTPRRWIHPVTFETLASPYVASRVEERVVDVDRVLAAYRALRQQGLFVVVEGGGVMVPIARNYAMIDLLKAFDLPSLVIGRAGRGTLNLCLLTLRMMQVMGRTPLGFLLNGYGQYGDGFAESLNPEVLRELADPVPVLGTLEWRPAYQDQFDTFIEALRQQEGVRDLLLHLTRPEEPSLSLRRSSGS